jgi:hypothetical protein
VVIRLIMAVINVDEEVELENVFDASDRRYDSQMRCPAPDTLVSPTPTSSCLRRPREI